MSSFILNHSQLLQLLDLRGGPYKIWFSNALSAEMGSFVLLIPMEPGVRVLAGEWPDHWPADQSCGGRELQHTPPQSTCLHQSTCFVV